MTACTENNNYGSNLDYLDDEEFEILLEHAAKCTYCDDLLRKYESDLMPMLKLAFAYERVPAKEEFGDHSSAFQRWIRNIFVSTQERLLMAFRKMIIFGSRVPVNAVGLVLFVSISIYAFYTFLYPHGESESNSELPKQHGLLTTTAESPTPELNRSRTIVSKDGVGRLSSAEQGTNSQARKRPTRTKYASVSIDEMTVEDVQPRQLLPDPRTDFYANGMVFKRADPSLSFIYVKLLVDPGSLKSVVCTLYSLSSKPEPPSVYRAPLNGSCSWELPSNSQYELVVTDTITLNTAKRTIITQKAEVQLMDIDLTSPRKVPAPTNEDNVISP